MAAAEAVVAMQATHTRDLSLSLAVYLFYIIPHLCFLFQLIFPMFVCRFYASASSASLMEKVFLLGACCCLLSAEKKQARSERASEQAEHEKFIYLIIYE